jgi:hypothetical protein
MLENVGLKLPRLRGVFDGFVDYVSVATIHPACSNRHWRLREGLPRGLVPANHRQTVSYGSLEEAKHPACQGDSREEMPCAPGQGRRCGDPESRPEALAGPPEDLGLDRVGRSFLPQGLSRHGLAEAYQVREN